MGLLAVANVGLTTLETILTSAPTKPVPSLCKLYVPCPLPSHHRLTTLLLAYADACTQAGHKIGPFIVDGAGSGASGGSSGSSTVTGAGSSSTGTPGAANAAAPARMITGLGALAGLTVVMAAIL